LSSVYEARNVIDLLEYKSKLNILGMPFTFGVGLQVWLTYVCQYKLLKLVCTCMQIVQHVPTLSTQQNLLLFPQSKTQHMCVKLSALLTNAI